GCGEEEEAERRQEGRHRQEEVGRRPESRRGPRSGQRGWPDLGPLRLSGRSGSQAVAAMVALRGAASFGGIGASMRYIAIVWLQTDQPAKKAQEQCHCPSA